MKPNKAELISRCYRLLTFLRTPHSQREIADELGFSTTRGAARSAGRYLRAIANDPDLGPRLKWKMELTGGRPKKMWWIDYMG